MSRKHNLDVVKHRSRCWWNESLSPRSLISTADRTDRTAHRLDAQAFGLHTSDPRAIRLSSERYVAVSGIVALLAHVVRVISIRNPASQHQKRTRILVTCSCGSNTGTPQGDCAIGGPMRGRAVNREFLRLNNLKERNTPSGVPGIFCQIIFGPLRSPGSHLFHAYEPVVGRKKRHNFYWIKRGIANELMHTIHYPPRFAAFRKHRNFCPRTRQKRKDNSNGHYGSDRNWVHVHELCIPCLYATDFAPAFGREFTLPSPG